MLTSDAAFTARAEALFASHLSMTVTATRADVATAIHTAVRRHGGSRGCAVVMAAEFGQYPETAAARMRWARATVQAVFGRERIQRHQRTETCAVIGRKPGCRHPHPNWIASPVPAAAVASARPATWVSAASIGRLRTHCAHRTLR